MLEEMLKRAKESLQCEDNIKIKIKPLKTSIARVSFKYRTITVDPVILTLNEEEIYYVIIHELAHLKAKTKHHTPTFWKEVEKVFPIDKAKSIEDEIIKKTKKSLINS